MPNYKGIVSLDKTSQMMQARDFIHSIMHTDLVTGLQRPLCVKVITDTTGGYDESMFPMQWFDAEQLLMIFGANSYHSGGTLAVGNGSVKAGGEATIIYYQNILEIRAILSEPDFNNIVTAVNGGALSVPFTAAQQANIAMKVFQSADPNYQIAFSRSSEAPHY